MLLKGKLPFLVHVWDSLAFAPDLFLDMFAVLAPSTSIPFFFVYACARSTLQPLPMHMSKIRNKRENEATIEKPSEGAFILKHPGRRKAYSETRETEIRTEEPRGSSLEEPSYDANTANCTEIPPPSGGLRKCP